MAFEKDTIEGGIEVTVRLTEEEYKILKYAGGNCYDTTGGQFHAGRSYSNPEEFIRKLLYWEILALQYSLGEVEKYRWQLMLDGKDPHIDLRPTHPELFVKSGGIVRDRKIPQFKPRFPALMKDKG